MISQIKISLDDYYELKNLKENVYYPLTKLVDKKNFKAIIGKFNIRYLDGPTEILNPELRIYNQPNIITSEADIKTNLLSDKFITMNYVQNQEFFNIRYQVKPFMIWIWISVLFISFAGLLSITKKRYEI